MGKNLPPKKIYAVSVWPTWIAVGIAWLLARLPLRALQRLGALAGSALYRIGGSRRRIAERNLALCYPELSQSERDAMTAEVFRHLGMGIFETTMPWLNPERDLASRMRVTGVENLRAAEAKGRGVLLVAAHFSTIDVLCAAVGELETIDVMYRRNKNPVWERLQVRGRGYFCESVIERQQTRKLLAALRRGRSVWYAADQDYGAKHSVFAPFFGVPAATITATARIAQLNQSPVVVMSSYRNTEDLTWHVAFHPELTDYPTGDDEADALRINQVLEREIRKYPEQYMWVHRRFKTRPPGEPSLYAKAQSKKDPATSA